MNPGASSAPCGVRGPVRAGPAPAAGPAQLADAIRSRSLFYRIMNRFLEFTI